ncbi:MAG: hypothetical protein AB2L24_22500 [Mangrovibacterium sp.]
MHLSKSKLFIAALLAGAVTFQGYAGKKPSQQWFKGNLHTHSYWSDGDAFPEMIMDWYKSHGYQFVALSDHNVLAEGEKWKLIPKNPLQQQAFEDYKAKYGTDWIEFKEDTGRVSVKLKTYAEYKPLFEEAGKFLIIPSEEISDGFERKPVHLNAANIQKLIPPQKGNSVSDVIQNNINAVLQQEKETGVPMMVQINHPNFHYAISTEDMVVLHDARFFEVFNGHPSVNNYGDSIHPGTEVMWDRINIAFLHAGKPLLFGLATDDSHHYHVFGSKYANAGRGWVMVQADQLTSASLIEAMEKGDFYASTGVTLKEVSLKKDQLKILVDTKPGVKYTIQFIGCRKNDQEARLLKETEGGKAVFDLDPDILFVRAKVVSDKLKENPFSEGDYEVAWCQPVTLH